MEKPGREEDAAGPPWAPSESTAFRPFAAAVGEQAETSPSAPGNGVPARSSNLRAVRKRPIVARLTTDIIKTFEKCNPGFKYSDSLNPKRFLTNPAVPVHNDGLDNANSDLILYVNLELVNKKSSRRYIVQEMLGQGTFGQVAKCWDEESNNYVAVKVIKNQPAFYQQAIMEVSVLNMLNQKFDPDEHHIVRMLDFFLCQNHLCIAFEMLGHNLYELLKRNSLRGLQMKYVRTFSRQILEALVVMKDARIIHCDLKPENILIVPTVKTGAKVKVIDFGSACMESKTIYSYIQSRYYRSPEVLLGYPYTTAIDMWSFGCIVAELYMGLPLFPGASEYDILSRMIEILGGQPHDDLLREAKNTARFFKHVGNIYPSSEARNGAGSAYRILTEDEVEARESKKPKVGRWYFPHGRLDRLIFTYPWKGLSDENLTETEKADCLALVDFLSGLLEFDPNKRWSPSQALCHPFITGEPFTGPYEPAQETPSIPIGCAAVVDHNPGGGHLLGAGLSPQVIGSTSRCLRLNNPVQQKMPYSYGSSYGSFGSHGSFNDNTGLASSYGSYDFNSANIYNSPMDPSGFNLRSQAGGSFLGSSPDIRRRSHFSHSGGIRLSPGGPGPMSLGASPSQFTPPNSQMQIPSGANGKYGASPARGGHGSLGKAAAVGQYNKRRNQGYPPMPMPSHEHTSQLIQGHQGDVTNATHFDAYGRGNSGYTHNALPSSSHFSWRPQRGIGNGLPPDPSSSHGSFPATNYNGFTPSYSDDVSADALPSTSIPDPANWDPNYSDELLLQEDHSLSAELSGLHLRGTSGQTNRSSRLAHGQSNDITSSNPPLNQRSGHLFHASSLRESTHATAHASFDGYNHVNYSQQTFPSYHGQPFQQYNMTSSHIRPMRPHHNGRPVWTNYSLAEPPPTAMVDGARPGPSFASSGLPPSVSRKDFGRIF